MRILAIETSCDETAAAVVEDGVTIFSNVVASSAAMHEKYGGVVPEIAAREQLKCIIPVIQEALARAFEQHANTPMQQLINEHVDAVAVTVGPGLIGSLLVGVETAKTIAFATGKPIIPVNHVLAHMYANVLSSAKERSSQVHQHDNTIAFPAVSLVVSGGHTELYLIKSMRDLVWLGGTLDDAAGEAFDKTARLLGFGSRGGPAIQEAARGYHPEGNPKSNKKNNSGSRTRTAVIALPRPMIGDETLNVSFSGLKTAVLREVNKQKAMNKWNRETIAYFAYEIQEAITDVLVEKTRRAVKLYNAKSVLLSGGVAANIRLRQKMVSAMKQWNNEIMDKKADHRLLLHTPPIHLCTDNASYIASYAYFRGEPLDWRQVTALPDLSVEVNE